MFDNEDSTLTWEQVAKALSDRTGLAGPDQIELGKSIGLRIAPETPRVVAGALLADAMHMVLAQPTPRPPTATTKYQIEEMRNDDDPAIEPKTGGEASAWIEYLYTLQRLRALTDLAPRTGDVVRSIRGDLGIVSSIGIDGRIYLRGVGQRAWPDLLSVEARGDETSDAAEGLRKQAQNLAALRQPNLGWSSYKHRELIEFWQRGHATSVEVDSLERVIDEADDERPIQAYLEEHPQLLAALVAGHQRYVLPQKRLGSQFVPDFAVAKTDSLGVEWTLIELESPRASIFLSNGTDLSSQTRKGVSQVEDWRNWLENNIAYARNGVAQQGLRLFDIRPRPRAIVLVGRRSILTEQSHARRNDLRDRHIHLHTYDWLLDHIRGASQF